MSREVFVARRKKCQNVELLCCLEFGVSSKNNSSTLQNANTVL